MKELDGNHALYLMRRARTYGEKPAIIDGDRTLSYTDLERRSSQFGRLLQSLGGARGERVAVFTSNRAEFFETLLGIWRAGMIGILINHRLTADEIQYQLEDTGAIAIVCSPDLRGTVDGANASAIPVVAYDESYEARLASFDGSELAVAVEPEHPIVIAYTSGTTGKPKGAIQTHRNMGYSIRVAD